MTSKVSILIPVYNAERYVGAAVESVLRQTWKDIEIIAVDDGSTDASPEILKRYAGRGVRYIRQPNTGASAARNAAFAASSGSYILYLDADDVVDPQHIEELIEHLDDVIVDVDDADTKVQVFCE